MKVFLITSLFILSQQVFSQPAVDTIQLHFLYGSVPAKGFKKTEPKLFGALKGGHVNIELNGTVLDFLPGNCPILPKNRKPTGGFHLNTSVRWDTATSKWATIWIPVTSGQLAQLEMIFATYPQKKDL